ncbi:hypothetical protein Trihar35433_8511 [Trichoderma harzianum]|nr:hypothetical protein Trihar35433_8511 [Trichoderma harzianum]
MPEPTTSEGQAIRARLVRRRIDRDVLSVLDSPIFWDDGRDYTLFDSIRSLRFSSEEGVPFAEIVDIVEEELTERQLSREKQKKVFTILGWYFECPRCAKDRTADKFEDTQFYLWTSTERAEPILQSSGPCIPCEQQPDADEFEIRNEYYTW